MKIYKDVNGILGEVGVCYTKKALRNIYLEGFEIGDLSITELDNCLDWMSQIIDSMETVNIIAE